MTKQWEVVLYGMDENFCTDSSVPPRVLARFWTRRMAERWEYSIARSRALSSVEDWRKRQTSVRRRGDWMYWNYVKQYGDKVGA